MTSDTTIRKIKKNINGQDIYIEVRDENGFTTVNPKCYSHLNGVGKKFSVKEAILLLLGVDPEIPLKMTLLMKESFLFEKELSHELNLNLESFQFVPYRYGPYSRKLEDTLNSMDGLIVISSVNKKEITLTLKSAPCNTFNDVLSKEQINDNDRHYQHTGCRHNKLC